MQALKKSISGFIFHFIKKQKSGFILLQVLALSWAFDATLWPYVLKMVIESLTNFEGPKAQIWGEISVAIVTGLSLWLCLEIMSRLSGIYQMLIAPKFEASIRMFMYDYVNTQSYAFFANNFAGTVANRIADMPRSAWMVMEMIVFTFLPVLMALIISLSIFATISPVFSALLAGWIITHLAICLFFARKCREYAHTHSESKSKLLGKIVDGLANNLNVRLFSRRSYEYQYTMQYQQDEVDKYRNSLWYVEKMKICLGINYFIIVMVLMTWYQIYSYQHGNLTLGELVYVFNTTSSIGMMAWFAGLTIPNFFSEVGVCQQALTLINAPIEIKDLPNASELKIDKGEIVFENVSFNYEYNNNILKNRNIIIAAGQKVGLVGYSGSGKSTFVNLILRCYDISGGKIMIDGQDIRQITQESLRAQIAMISQEPILFHRTIMENIRYGNLNATEEQVKEACKIANCDEFVSKLPQKYETIAGERGAKLSGGQKQRIAIARAILKDAPILILDEATSALDSVTEKYIQESIQQLMKNKTTIIIAHRLSTLADMDRILVFKDGDIVEDGTEEELLALGGEYAKLWNMQKNGALPDQA